MTGSMETSAFTSIEYTSTSSGGTRLVSWLYSEKKEVVKGFRIQALGS